MRLFATVIVALALASTVLRAEEYKVTGPGWYMFDPTFKEPVVAGPFASKDKCLLEIAAVAKGHPKDAVTLECRYIGS